MNLDNNNICSYCGKRGAKGRFCPDCGNWRSRFPSTDEARYMLIFGFLCFLGMLAVAVALVLQILQLFQ